MTQEIAELAAQVDAESRARPGAPASHPDFDALVRTVWRLRRPDGCPWDREQTHESIAQSMVEEAFEALDAIEGSQRRHLQEELGDVLLQVLLHAQISDDAGGFDIDAVCRSLNEKLVRRHPHVFADASADTANDTLGIWDRVKLEEQRAQGAADQEAGARPEGLLSSVPVQLPALMQAQKISRKAASAGFDWDSDEDVWQQVASEISEFRAEPEGSAAAQMEFGDILFALVNVARRQHIDAESALRAACTKFRGRWEYMEDAALASGRTIADVPNCEQEALWAQAKLKERDL
jgi:tetrapyrrole methylase family protein/MazG family protein